LYYVTPEDKPLPPELLESVLRRRDPELQAAYWQPYFDAMLGRMEEDPAYASRVTTPSSPGYNEAATWLFENPDPNATMLDYYEGPGNVAITPIGNEEIEDIGEVYLEPVPPEIPRETPPVASPVAPLPPELHIDDLTPTRITPPVSEGVSFQTVAMIAGGLLLLSMVRK